MYFFKKIIDFLIKNKGKFKKDFTIKAIVAVDQNRGIGRNGNLLFYISDDMKHFARNTNNGAIIMRSGTFNSMGRKPLKNRLNIVISRNKNYEGNGATVVHSLDTALEFVKKNNYKTAWIIGGAGLYAEALDSIDEIYLTQIFSQKPADTFFPEYINTFQKISEQDMMYDKKNKLNFQFQTWKNKKTM